MADLFYPELSQPIRPSPWAPNLPLVSLSPGWSTTSGSLTGGNTYYYAVSANDQAGQEGALSFTVVVAIPPGTNTNAATLTQLSFPLTATSFNVYRGTNPQIMYRIASGVPLAGSL